MDKIQEAVLHTNWHTEVPNGLCKLLQEVQFTRVPDFCRILVLGVYSSCFNTNECHTVPIWGHADSFEPDPSES